MTFVSIKTRRAIESHGYNFNPDPLPGCCVILGCTRKRNGRNRTCSAHMMAIWRKRYPELAQFARLKDKAKKRRKQFDITKAEWMEICRLTRYHENTGNHREALTIDRIRHREGYKLSNIRVIVKHLNCAKGSYERTSQLRTGRAVTLALAATSIAEQLETEIDF